MKLAVSKKMACEHGIIILTTLLIFFLVPLFMIVNSPIDYTFIDKLILIKVGGILASIYLALYLFLYWILHLFKLQRIASFITIFLFYWVLFSGYLFPLVQKTGMQEALDIATNKVNFFLVLSLTLFLTIMLKTKLRRGVIVFTFVFLSLSWFSNFYSMSLEFDSKNRDKAKKFTQLSKENNIIVLSLDGLPGKISYDLIEKNSELKHLLKDFILFENVISSSPATQGSITGEMLGNQDFKKIGGSQGDIYSKLDYSELLINQKDLDVYTYYGYNPFNLQSEKKINLGELIKPSLAGSSQADFLMDFYQYIAVRLGTYRLLKTIKFIDISIVNRSSIPSLFSKNPNSLPQRLENHKGEQWAKMNIANILEFDYMVNNLSIGPSPKSARFMHFVFTHYPVDFDENCNYRSDNEAWFKSNQNEQGIINLTKCGLNKFSFFISKLKELGIYDNSFIVLKSDHGQPAFYYSSGPDNYKINGHYLGYNRYTPMLLIKEPYSNKNVIQTNKNLVVLDDLAKTLCRNNSIHKNCDIYPGINILDEAQFTSRDLYIFVPKDQYSTFTFEGLSTVVLNGNDFLQALQNNPNIKLEN